MSAPILLGRGLASLPLISGGVACMGAPADPTPALYAERNRLIGLIGGLCGETDKFVDRRTACDDAAIASPATIVKGAITSLCWARDELVEFDLCPDPSSQLVLSLLDSALGVLRRQAIGETMAAPGVSAGPADRNQVGA